jgi:hypothetical protein
MRLSMMGSVTTRLTMVNGLKHLLTPLTHVLLVLFGAIGVDSAVATVLLLLAADAGRGRKYGLSSSAGGSFDKSSTWPSSICRRSRQLRRRSAYSVAGWRSPLSVGGAGIQEVLNGVCGS